MTAPKCDRPRADRQLCDRCGRYTRRAEPAPGFYKVCMPCRPLVLGPPPAAPVGVDLDALVAVDLADESWRQVADCRDTDPSVFFPVGTVEAQALYERARGVCAGCPSRLQCLAFGLGEDNGCWGGTSPRDRRRIRKALRERQERAA